jgi:Rps23 Pro-64 3,4-dihydroxylase Tpa1-like proline 4-hydroxylase
LYLVPEEWQASDGGALDLFCVDSTGNPSHSVKSLTPQWNAFAFFEVSPVSFHQVAEVISKQRRNSVVGWFHGEPVKRDPLLPDPPVAFSIPQSISSSASETLKEWIAPVYLKAQTLASIRTAFVDQSSITLPNFFRSDKYSAVLSAMEQQSTPPGRIDIPTGSNGNVDHPNSSTANKWTMIGPPNKRHFWQYKCESNAADIVQQCAKFLCSSNLAMLLQEMTGLSLSSVCQPEVRKFNHGCYTMGHDTDPGLTQPGLDVCFSLATKAWNSEKWGGHTQYLDSEEALLAFDPLPNQLSLVFRGAPGAFRFVKHVNHKAKDSARYDMECTFHVDDDDDDEIVQ